MTNRLTLVNPGLAQRVGAACDGDGPVRQNLVVLVEELDIAAFDAEERCENGTETDQVTAFRRARAATAVLAAFQEDSRPAVADTRYETYHALDENLRLITNIVDAVP